MKNELLKAFEYLMNNTSCDKLREDIRYTLINMGCNVEYDSETEKYAATQKGTIYPLLQKEHGIEQNPSRRKEIFIIVEDCYNDETVNVACFDSETEAQAFCDKHNKQEKLKRFDYESWCIGEIVERLK